MGGKGQKRREKNYLKSHGGDKRLPPPPQMSSIHAIPSKLRKLMSYSSSLSLSLGNSENAVQLKAKKRDAYASQNKPQSVAENEPKSSSISAKIEKMSAMLESEEKINPGVDDDKKKKKKRKRKEVNDLRFTAEMEKLGVISKRKQRKKEFLKNKKKKQQKGASEQILDLPKRDKVKFGDVVQAPPKLDVVPKAPKKPMNASQERLRLQAIEAYRNRKGNNRLGIQLPSLNASSEEQ